MTTELWALTIVGALSLGHLWVMVGVCLNLLKKVDKMEDKLIASGEQFPHLAYLEMQRAAVQVPNVGPIGDPSAVGQNTWRGTEAV